MNAREGVEAIVDGAFPDREARRRIDLFEAAVRAEERTATYRAAAVALAAVANPNTERGAGVRWAAGYLRARANEMESK